MTPDEVKPFVRHWVEVYTGKDPWPSYRGMFLCGDGVTFAVNRGEGDDDAVPTPNRAGLKIADIVKIVPLGDPPWLIRSNKAAALMSARGILRPENL